MRQFDPVVKHILDRFGPEFARLLFNEPGLQVLQRLDTQQLSIKVHQNDMTFKVQRANGEVFLQHIEVQTTDSTDIPMPLRVLGYASALVLRYRLPVYSMVLYLSRNAGRTDPGTYEYQAEGLGLRLDYKVIRFAELEGGTFLEQATIGLLPFTPLMKPPAGMSPEAWVEACVAKTYDAPVDSETRSTLLFALSLLGSLAHGSELFQQLISEEIMQESPFYEVVLQRGITQGIARGARETTIKNILTVLDTRFSESDTRPAATALEAIVDKERLDQILNTALVAATFSDFLQALHSESRV